MNEGDLYKLCYDTKETSAVSQLHLGPFAEKDAIGIAIIGDYGVGKTALVHRLCRGQFLTKHKATKSVQRHLVSVRLSNGERMKMIIYDTAGCKRLQGEYLYRCKGALIVYDITEPYSFNNVQLHLNEVKRTMPPDTQVLLLGTKCDMTELRKVPFATAELFASAQNLSIMEVSARTDCNVQTAFVELAERIIEKERVDRYEPLSLETMDQEIGPMSKLSFFCCFF
ncbi:Ras family protein [Trichuris suis]|nr:Ras family protein [Trichuris suis]